MTKKFLEGKLVKGTGDTMVQDMFRAVATANGGGIGFNPVTMMNVCFAKLDGCDKVYAFNNPRDLRLCEGTKVKVNTSLGQKDATVVSSIKIQAKYLSDLMYAFCGKRVYKLQDVIGVYTVQLVENKVLDKFS